MRLSRKLFCLLLVACALKTQSQTASTNIFFRGVNLAGAEFGESQLPGTYGVHYTYPTRDEVDYFTAKGMNAIRLPFRWERLQRSLNGALDSTEFSRLNSVVNHITSRNAWVILDPHNYARYNHQLIGSAALPISAFTNFWARVASNYKNNSRVVFGLVNEPHTMSTEVWRDAANAAIVAIRNTGATNLILVPGNAWTGAHSWSQNWYGTPNATVMRTIVDPANNYAFEVHQYLDSDSSGTSSTCVSATIGAQRLANFTAWCRTNKKRGFLGEFGAAANTICLEALANIVNYVESNEDVWIGWAYWAAGPWWGDYMFSIEPFNGVDRPQMNVLEEFFPVPQPTLTFNPSGSGAAVISFQSAAGFIYQCEVTSSLEMPWSNFAAPVTGTGSIITIPIALEAGQDQFFRIRVERAP